MQPVKTKLITVAILIVMIAGVLTAMHLTDGKLESYPYDMIADDVSDIPLIVDALDEHDTIIFSETEYFHANPITLTLSCENMDVQEIYYTLDATPPNTDKGILYKEPFKLKGSTTDRQKSYVVKTCGKKTDGTFTEVYTHSYFIGEKISERFDVLVFSLSTDPYNLYDYDYGIFVPGRLRDEYTAETGDKNPDPPAPANYNMRGRESERPVHVELLDQDGNLILAQNAGMRTFGGWSRAMDQKSIKLFARKEYDIQNKFDYDFFPDHMNLNGLSVTNYRRLVLRNSANDSPFAFLRDEAISSMAKHTALQDVQHTRPVAVFLNGKYYGFAWLHQVYDTNYLDDMNGIQDGEWAILEGGEKTISEEEEDPFNIIAIEDYYAMYAYNEKDLTDNQIFEELCNLIDIDNFLTYYAIEIYVGNSDWPHGNYKVYKYYGDPSLIWFDEHTADGKWRWLLYDTDFGLGLYDHEPSEKSLGVILGKEGYDEESYSPLLAAILERDDMKEKFVRILCDLMNDQFSPRTITKITQQKEAERLQELTYNFKHGGAQLSNTWSNIEYVNYQVDNILMYGFYRCIEMQKQISTYLHVDESGFMINVATNDTADIMVNTCLINDQSRSFEGFYYDINTVVITASPYISYDFSHWIVNDSIIYEPVLYLNTDMAVNDKIKVELVTSKPKADTIKPIVTLIDYEGSMDYIQIFNPYDTAIHLKKYYISDNGTNIYKQTLADYMLEPNETLNLYCKNYNTIDALGGFALDFNLKNGESLYITDSTGTTIETIYLPKIKNESVLVRDMKTGRFYDTLRIDTIDQFLD